MPEKEKELKTNLVALGEDIEDVIEIAHEEEPVSLEDKISSIEKRIFNITSSMDSLFQMVKELRDSSKADIDKKVNEKISESKEKAEIPEGTELVGTSRGINYFCMVRSGGFFVGITKYASLSAAAEGVSGVRRSGWTFWKLPDGRTVKEAYK